MKKYEIIVYSFRARHLQSNYSLELTNPYPNNDDIAPRANSRSVVIEVEKGQ